MDTSTSSKGGGQMRHRMAKRGKKRKSCTTRGYREREAEVQQLLQAKSSSSQLQSSHTGGSYTAKDVEVDVDAQSNEFFFELNMSAAYGTLSSPSRHEQKLSDSEYTGGKRLTDSDVDDDDDADADDVGDEEATETGSAGTQWWKHAANYDAQSASRLSARTAAQASQATGATYIKIDLVEPIVKKGLQLSRHHYEDDLLLYKPNAKPNLQYNLTVDGKACTAATMRMLNRIYEQAKATGIKIDESVLMQLRSGPVEYLKDKKLYRTVCAHEFHPIFVSPQPVLQPLMARKLILLHFKQLRFSAHQQLLREHEMANELADLYEQYKAQRHGKLVAQLYADLQTTRKLLEKLTLPACDDADATITPRTALARSQEMEQYLTQAQKLRMRYYDAATSEKQMLQSILNKWAELKLLRKQQQYQCTRFQLRLHVDQPQDVAHEYEKLKARFDADLSEIYRERLEIYYMAKREWRNAQVGSGEPSVKPPRKPNIEKLREKLKEQYAISFYDPEQLRVHITRSDAADMSLLYHNLPGQRGQQKLRSYYLKVYFDGQFVGQTRSYRLEPDLHLHMHETLGILLARHMPQQANIVLIEKNKLPTHSRIAEISWPLNVATSMQKLPFKGQHSAGDLYLHIDLDEEKGTNALFGDVRVAVRAPAQAVVADDGTAGQQLATDDDDDDAESISSTEGYYFEENTLEFCSMQSMLENKRLRLLRSRYARNDPRTKDLRGIPALEHEIDFDWDAPAEPVIDMGNWMDAIDLFKHEGKKTIRGLYETVWQHCARMAKLKEHSGQLLVGDDDEPASWAVLFRALGSLFKPRRPLHPLSSVGKGNGAGSSAGVGPPISTDTVQTFNIVLNVVRSTGIPVRSRQILQMMDTARSNDAHMGAMFMSQAVMYSNVRPFIALSYRHKVCRTSTAEGSNPTWNEQLVLTTKGCVKDLRDELKITLYDELIEQQISESSMDVYQRVQTNWLGEYRVPISSLIKRQHFEGCFELTTPKVLLGYKRPTIDSVTNIANIDSYPVIKEAVHLWCYLSIEPQCTLPALSTRSLECTELQEVREHLLQWCAEMKQLQPTRFIDPLVCTAAGQRVCLTRLLTPLRIGVSSREQPTLDSACRFVSLLSVLKQYDACMGFQGVWLDNKCTLDNTWCSAKDLGVLLCNYMLALGLQCWLVLGLAAPFGECTFVLYRPEQGGELLLIAPHTGKRYGIKDVHCPLSRVYCIVAQDNFYVNIQAESRVTMTNFSLHDSACWLPAFSKRNPAPLGGVQHLDYNYKPTANYSQLRKNIEHKIMKKISAWRPMRKTIWNRAFQPQLLRILQQMEYLTTHADEGNYEEPKYGEQLEQLFPEFKFYGFTINFTYTNLSAISERIRSTGIHLINDKYVEYSVAVHIHPYANNVLSVWIFLITIIPY